MSCTAPETCITTVFVDQDGSATQTTVTPSGALESTGDGSLTIQPPPAASFRFRFEADPGGEIVIAGAVQRTGEDAVEFCREAAQLSRGLMVTVTVRFARREEVRVVKIKRPYPKDITSPGPGTGSGLVASSPALGV